MKKFFLILLLSTLTLGATQPCKVVKPGMTKSKVLRLAGKPDEQICLGTDNGRDSIYAWHYKNQIVYFVGDKVDGEVVSDTTTYYEFLRELPYMDMDSASLIKAIMKINAEGCK